MKKSCTRQSAISIYQPVYGYLIFGRDDAIKSKSETLYNRTFFPDRYNVLFYYVPRMEAVDDNIWQHVTEGHGEIVYWYLDPPLLRLHLKKC